MIRVAIVEDDKRAVMNLEAQLKEYQSGREIKFQIESYQNAIRFLDQYRMGFDIIFMDIDMPYIDGMEAARQLRKIDENVVLVFVTSLAQYAVQGYDVGAMDFLVKPVKYKVLEQKLDRALSAVSKNRGKKIIIRSENRIKVIDSQSLLYIEMYDHYLHFHLEDSGEIYRLRGTLAAAKEMLDELYFEECNKGMLVNLSKVDAVEGFEVILMNGERLPVSRAKKSSFLKRLAEYFGNWKFNMGRLQ